MGQTTPPRSEDQIFADLSSLTKSIGYAHAIAMYCIRDNLVSYSTELDADDLKSKYSKEGRLLRTEISTIIGLMIQGDIDFALSAPHDLNRLIYDTDRLLSELHESMSVPMFATLLAPPNGRAAADFFSQGSILREPIFYGGDSAYDFQYRDLSAKKYLNDTDWLKKNKGFSIEDALEVIRCIVQFLNENVSKTRKRMRAMPPEEWTMLPKFIFSTDELVNRFRIDRHTVTSVIEAFSLEAGSKNEQFRSIGDFNAVNAFPIIRLRDQKYLLYQSYSISEAMYESPFYWMLGDKPYASLAMTNRGLFTEKICAERLILVFGDHRVFVNVKIVDSRGEVHGEIDVLAVYANRAVILQAKSKRLTQEARKGNDKQIKRDFGMAIQSAYDQGLSCAQLIANDRMELEVAGSGKFKISRIFKEIFIFCVLSDHYPSLAFQASQFLKFEQTEWIRPPFVMDVFLLDAMTEMLQSPLRFLSYISRRVMYADKIMATQELTVLSYHLKQNLWFESDFDMICLDDGLGVDLDAAMMTRRLGVPGKATPDGILTRLINTSVGRIISTIDQLDDVAIVDLGFLLLSLSEEATLDLSRGIDEISNLAARDFRHHDFTIGLSEARTGLTVHCNSDPQKAAEQRLYGHCSRRKYSQKARSWFGLCIKPLDGRVRFGLHLEFPWAHSKKMNRVAKQLPSGRQISTMTATGRPKRRKIGRNEPCPCGSGRKYKKCCLNS